MSILDKLTNLKKADISAVEARIPMSAERITELSGKLKADNRLNVYPNRFDDTKPYVVTVKKSGQFKNYGTFTNVDVAAAVGTIASKAAFGENAIAGKYDQVIVEAHPEFQEWLASPKSAETLKLANA